ncbi:hypothetical protein OHA72_38870 [Dactylosporangium sp. NBC_01737]|uniref:hypothetical protein n=1 Tax=Dactylosporangium sp. NBC_01737 TaxID=2975959 RepID=UPI002E12537F|nr:hypothetical protein OHA72_38870 [Dactylosporangium sp. NBC_01737]
MPSTVERAAPAKAAGVTLARPAQLPMGPSTFVGRDDALAGAARVIARADAAAAAVIVSGPIGVGKTTFALRLADDLSAAFPDGQLYADLGGTAAGAPSAVTVVRGFLHALGVAPALVPDDPAQRIGLFRSLLAQRRVFVLLENAADERQVRPLLGRSTSSQIVVTSRARLLGLDGVHRIDLDTFTRHESLTLIGRLAGVERIRAEREAADTLADLCGNLPLAINIVGRRIAARPEWRVADLSGLLADAERLMTSLSVGDIRVRDCFAAAYQRLTPAARHALHQVAHTGAGMATATAAGLAAAMGVAPDVADELLESLVDSGLLTRADRAGRYGVSTLVRAFTASTPHAVRAPETVQPRPDLTAARRMLVRANAGRTHTARRDVVA